MQPVERIDVEDVKVVCDGGGGALGHPRVYLNMGEAREIDCPYCGRRFVLKGGAKAAAGSH
ncbi:MAG: zinc-finger domain-containing protein [Rhodospirillales bacterium]|nr:MAG: zinc-finger domain-containing protein [Rhodospirillales bacterium]